MPQVIQPQQAQQMQQAPVQAMQHTPEEIANAVRSVPDNTQFQLNPLSNVYNRTNKYIQQALTPLALSRPQTIIPTLAVTIPKYAINTLADERFQKALEPVPVVNQIPFNSISQWQKAHEKEINDFTAAPLLPMGAAAALTAPFIGVHGFAQTINAVPKYLGKGLSLVNGGKVPQWTEWLRRMTVPRNVRNLWNNYITYPIWNGIGRTADGMASFLPTKQRNVYKQTRDFLKSKYKNITKSLIRNKFAIPKIVSRAGLVTGLGSLGLALWNLTQQQNKAINGWHQTTVNLRDENGNADPQTRSNRLVPTIDPNHASILPFSKDYSSRASTGRLNALDDISNTYNDMLNMSGINQENINNLNETQQTVLNGARSLYQQEVAKMYNQLNPGMFKMDSNGQYIIPQEAPLLPGSFNDSSAYAAAYMPSLFTANQNMYYANLNHERFNLQNKDPRTMNYQQKQQWEQDLENARYNENFAKSNPNAWPYALQAQIFNSIHPQSTNR